jgi:photosystem II oxygen-evolving enhancer protein 1
LQAAQALTYDELQSLTYLQVKGSGIANTCPVIEGGSTNLKDLKPGTYKMDKFCMEPTQFLVKEESQFKGGDTDFVKTKLMTRLTYTLDAVSGLALLAVLAVEALTGLPVPLGLANSDWDN